MNPLHYAWLAGMLFSFGLNAETRAVESSAQQTKTRHHQSLQSEQQTLQQQALQWGLSVKDYQRYQELMQGARGIRSPGLDPLTALGIEATSQAEREKFAELWVKQEAVRVEKELAFQRAVDAAWKRLYPALSPVRLGDVAETGKSSRGATRLMLFIKISDCAACDTVLSEALSRNIPLDIYVSGSTGDDARLRGWATEKAIPLSRLKSADITLNHDTGQWQQWGQGKMPALLAQGEQGWEVEK